MSQQRSSRTLLGLFAFALASLTLAADGYFVWAIANQLGTLRYPSVVGQITVSQIVEEPGDESILYRPQVEYSYQVNGQAYVGKQVGAWESATSNRALAKRVTDKYVVGQSAPVFYSPRDPSRAILDRRLDANNGSFACVLASFNIVAGAVFVAAFGPAWRRRRNLPPPQMRLRHEGAETVVRLYSLTPRSAAVAPMAVISFLTGAVSAFLGIYDWQEKSLALGVAAALYFGWQAWWKAYRQAVVLRIRPHETLQVERLDTPPRTFDLSRREVRRVDAKRRPDPDAEEVPRDMHVVRLICASADETGETMELASLQERADAQWIAEWLAERLTARSP